MNKYQQSKIYKLTSPHTDQIYIGSTCQKLLSNRLGEHKYEHINRSNKNISSFKLFELGNVKIELIENYPCNSRQELIIREQHWLNTSPNCINTKNAYISIEDKKAQKQIKDKKYLLIKINCICGSNVIRKAIARHNKTLKHQVHVLLDDFTRNKIYK